MNTHAPPLAKTLRTLGTTCIGLFCAQLALAVAGSLWPALGPVLYPVFVGLAPSSIPILSLNVTLLSAALGALYFAEKVERDACRRSHAALHPGPTDESPGISL